MTVHRLIFFSGKQILFFDYITSLCLVKLFLFNQALPFKIALPLLIPLSPLQTECFALGIVDLFFPFLLIHSFSLIQLVLLKKFCLFNFQYNRSFSKISSFFYYCSSMLFVFQQISALFDTPCLFILFNKNLVLKFASKLQTQEKH